jgi:hypothetical protein
MSTSRSSSHSRPIVNRPLSSVNEIMPCVSAMARPTRSSSARLESRIRKVGSDAARHLPRVLPGEQATPHAPGGSVSQTRCGGARVECAAGWMSPRAWSACRRCCSSTSRPPGWTPGRAVTCGTWCGAWSPTARRCVLTTQYLEEADQLSHSICVRAGSCVKSSSSAPGSTSRRGPTRAVSGRRAAADRVPHMTERARMQGNTTRRRYHSVP